MTKNRLASILREEGLTKVAAKTYISPKVEVTPAMTKAMKAAEKLWDYGLRLESRGGKVVLSTYREGYIKMKEYGRVTSYPSVGGDYNIPYKESPDRMVELRAMVSLAVEFSPDGKVSVTIDKPTWPISGRQWADGKTEVLAKAKGFGRAGVGALKKAKESFDYWEGKFGE